MIFKELEIPGAYAIELEKRSDERGFFARAYCEDEFREQGLVTRWVQMNQSLSKEKGTLRGLHYQKPPSNEAKLIRCIRGAVWDVIVDIRKDSATHGKWAALELTDVNRTMMYAPNGFAHGFISLTDDAEILYMVSAPYSPQLEGTLRWDDPFHGIDWPLTPVQISEKDRNAEEWNETKAIQL